MCIYVCVCVCVCVCDFCSVMTEILPLREGFTIVPNVLSEFFIIK